MMAKACVLWVLVCAVLLSGCSNTATISMADGHDYEVTIYGGDKDHVYGRIDEYIKDKPEPVKVYKKLRRDEVREIDHPGNVQMVAGGSLFVLGAASTIALLVSWPGYDEGDESSVFYSPYWGVFGLIDWLLGVSLASTAMVGGGAMFVEGADRWFTSRDAAAAERGVEWQMRPMVVPDGEGGLAPGVGLRLSW